MGADGRKGNGWLEKPIANWAKWTESHSGDTTVSQGTLEGGMAGCRAIAGS